MDANGVSRPGVAVSTDNGLNWVVRTVPDAKSISPGSDPSVAAGANNTMYFGYVNVDGHAKIAVSTDRGLHWSKSKDAGTPFGIQNAEFAEVIAGDDNRAAFAFLGTPTAGDTQSADFRGIWHLYVAFTYNAGGTWTTVDATPGRQQPVPEPARLQRHHGGQVWARARGLRRWLHGLVRE
jgi:hypothetical protein